jgi:hypothetical protein
MKGLDNLIQELKSPKERKNTFGGYKYRSCEDILNAVKPLLAKHGLSLRITDEPLLVGNFNYIRATAVISDGDQTVEVSAVAREAETKKGMDVSQITGSTSSYARKYALNGLFLIDDSQDADTQKPEEGATKEQKDELKKLGAQMDDQGRAFIEKKLSGHLTQAEADNLIHRAEAKIDGRTQ